MLKKSYTFALLAAALIITPTAAFANGSESRQEINQSGAAIGNGARVNQRATQTSIQQRTRRGSGLGICKSNGGTQNSDQLINQDGVAIDYSRVDQRANQENIQRQREVARRYCN